ncbi:glutaredoxin 3 [Endozoicomonas sp. OPT23]|uniref:glutaredoxin 3 n=1 Tax=Endozoicomonas sp. OPT23 TaxID=2072845 RepID=UPI00129A99EC|nr:glutaredoxin 3 [Endozoicomonas sp. OPT23]MRI32565.1 glutaredoxin 3 [Endozoicomonas sp. OPT23]
MAPVTIYLSAYCPFCHRAVALLEQKGASYESISVDGKPDLRQFMTEKAGSHTVPQIWVGDTHVGGCDDLFALERAGKLEPLLAGDK